MAKIIVNGEDQEVQLPVTVSELIKQNNVLQPEMVSVQVNEEFVEREDLNKVGNVFAKSFNFKDDETKRKTYGIIAQEVQEAGLDELVHQKEDGTLGVDYTSLLILKTAYLEDFCAMLNGRIVELENKIKEMENKG